MTRWDDIPRLDKSALSIGRVCEPSDENAYWCSQKPEQRWRALEINRSIAYGYGSTPPRFQRILEVVRANSGKL